MNKIITDRSVVEQALSALGWFVSTEMTVGQRYTNEGQRCLDSIETLNATLKQHNVDPEAFIMRQLDDDFGARLHRVVTVEDFAGDKKKFLDWGFGNADQGWVPLYSASNISDVQNDCRRA